MAATPRPTVRHHLVSDDAARRGWPEAGGIWLAELDERVRGALVPTFEVEHSGWRDDGAPVSLQHLVARI
ncbi:MAG TPA: hypothetical protein VFN48_09130 [Solirubrobacteraceae bacterium]|nr:hypothetical protein [Solirubrobacteraceae bacterium]